MFKLKNIMDRRIFREIVKKKELSKLPKKDVERVFKKFEEEEVSDKEKIRLTRDLLNKVFWPFRSDKLLSIKNKPVEWILRKHFSTRERLPFYKIVYERIFKKIPCDTVIDLGSGINGFSYKYLLKKINYVAVEAVGQLVDLMNYYFKKEKIKGKAHHFSLFELEKVKKVIKESKKPRVIFLFKVLDNLEMLEKDYSKKFLTEIVPLGDKIVISFATQSMNKREKFKVNRKWLVDFITQNFKLLDDFEVGGERYLLIRK